MSAGNCPVWRRGEKGEKCLQILTDIQKAEERPCYSCRRFSQLNVKPLLPSILSWRCVRSRERERVESETSLSWRFPFLQTGNSYIRLSNSSSLVWWYGGVSYSHSLEMLQGSPVCPNEILVVSAMFAGSRGFQRRQMHVLNWFYNLVSPDR